MLALKPLLVVAASASIGVPSLAAIASGGVGATSFANLLLLR